MNTGNCKNVRAVDAKGKLEKFPTDILNELITMEHLTDTQHVKRIQRLKKQKVWDGDDYNQYRELKSIYQFDLSNPVF